MTATLLIAGDVVNTHHRDGLFCDAALQQFIRSTDFAIANLEAPIGNSGIPARKSGPVLFQDRGTLSGLKDQGFHAVALANNHIMDLGTAGLEATLQGLRAVGLACVGAGLNRPAAYQPLIVERNGLQIGFVNGCEAHHGVHDDHRAPHEAGYGWLFADEFMAAIEASSSEHDVTIVLAHAGLEHYPIPQNEWRTLYRRFCRHGADAVVGSHPHVPQGCERFGESLIFYSLGNFYFDTNRYVNSSDESYSVLLRVGKRGVESWDRVWTKKTAEFVVERITTPDPTGAELDGMLLDGYEERCRAMTVEKYRELRPLLERSIGGSFCYSSTRAILRHLASRLVGRTSKVNRELLFEHLLRNESYYYAIREALAMATKSTSISRISKSGHGDERLKTPGDSLARGART